MRSCDNRGTRFVGIFRGILRDSPAILLVKKAHVVYSGSSSVAGVNSLRLMG